MWSELFLGTSRAIKNVPCPSCPNYSKIRLHHRRLLLSTCDLRSACGSTKRGTGSDDNKLVRVSEAAFGNENVNGYIDYEI
jgi:hypothetical protein